ncbi:hypothetical protein [Halorubrum californiense]|uniref:hypothetical protein n=1 Tax=Halorubrum californiense TaxID=416585 RepID=UPI001EF9CE4A|nr:hypothetical protein [Halorubrum californiense]
MTEQNNQHILREITLTVHSTNLSASKEVHEVVQQYLRRERPLNALVVVFSVLIFLGVYSLTSLLPAVLVGGTLLVGMRLPILQSNGTFQLRTEERVDTVIDDFTGPTPPVLALQWGVADEVSVEGGTASYAVSYLFGLRAADVTVRTETYSNPDGDKMVELEVTTDGQDWATYTATINDTGEQTAITVTYNSDRRFGLRRVPQQLIVNQYRDDALSAQGYSVVARDSHFGF